VTRILIIDDEPQILRALRINLTARQYDVTTAADAEQGLREAERSHPDLIVLDLGLPDLDGVEVIRKLRTWSPVPILVLSGRGGSREKVAALDAGADDYVTKPFSVDELLARVRAVTRRLSAPDATLVVELGEYTVDLDRHVAHRTDASEIVVHLTPTEWKLLTMLISNPGKLVGQRQLLQEVWGPTYLTESHYLRQYMAQLRRKFEADPSRPRYLLTDAGMGYRFQP
jgi:two-component system, OmpR family, KDP operon response regulator KdpE